VRVDDRNDTPALALTNPDAGAATSWRPASVKIRDKLFRPRAKFRGAAASDKKLPAIDNHPDALRQRPHHANSAELLIGCGDDDAARVHAVFVRAYPDRTTRMAQAEYDPRA